MVQIVKSELDQAACSIRFPASSAGAGGEQLFSHFSLRKLSRVVIGDLLRVVTSSGLSLRPASGLIPHSLGYLEKLPSLFLASPDHSQPCGGTRLSLTSDPQLAVSPPSLFTSSMADSTAVGRTPTRGCAQPSDPWTTHCSVSSPALCSAWTVPPSASDSTLC